VAVVEVSYPENVFFSNPDYFFFGVVKISLKISRSRRGWFSLAMLSPKLTPPTIPIKYPDYLAMACGGEAQ
jgi:hypothetical protein